MDSIGGIPAYLWLRNGAFMGLPFVALGDWIRRNQVRLTERLTKMNLIAMLLSGAVLTVIEAGIVQRLTGDDRELYLGTLLMVGAMFLWAVKEPQRAGKLADKAGEVRRTDILPDAPVGNRSAGHGNSKGGTKPADNRVDKAVCGDGAVGGDKRRVAQVPDDDKGSQVRIANAPK